MSNSTSIPSYECEEAPGMLLPSSFVAVGETTFQYEDQMPDLPVPPLDGAMDMYLESVKLHVSPEEYKHTEEIVKKFKENEGKQLHQKIQNKAKGQRNWLARWWEDKAYLESRGPLGPFSNFTGPGPEYPLDESKQAENLAMTMWYMVQYYLLIRREKLKIEKSGRKTVFDMDQIRGLFCTYRAPGEKRDKLTCYFKTEREGSCSRDIAVMCRGYVFKMSLFYSNDDRTPLTMPEIQSQLDHIQAVCEDRPYGPSVGALTAEDRATWHKLRQHIMDLHLDNRKHLQFIEECMFCTAFDENKPKDRSQKFHGGICGDPRNRWYDKSTVAIGFANGPNCCNADHTPFEATTTVAEVMFLCQSYQLNDGKWKGTHKLRPLPKPQEMVFHLDDSIHAAVKQAVKKFHQSASLIEIYTPTFAEFGKKFLKRVKIHPDSFMQIALQLAYYRLHKKFAPTYETGTARLYYHGRTETVRTCTLECADFCKAMCDASMTNETKLKLLLEAYNKHIAIMTKAFQFESCDRLMLGFYCVVEEEGLPLPDIFTDPAFVRSGGGGHFVLSTSCIGFSPVHGGMVAMTRNGYGVFYSITDEAFLPFISCYKDDDDTSCYKFYDYLCQAFRDMKALLDIKLQQSQPTSASRL